MNEIDWKMLQARRSCALLTRDEMEEGKVPTVSTTASIIAGIQCQEAVKLLHGLDVLAGQGFVFEGMQHPSYVVRLHAQGRLPGPRCRRTGAMLPRADRADTRAGDLLERVRGDLGPRGRDRDRQRSACPRSIARTATRKSRYFASLGKVHERQGRCPKCGEHRTPNVYHTIDGREPFLDRTLAEFGIPPWDVLGGRCGQAAGVLRICRRPRGGLGAIEC